MGGFSPPSFFKAHDFFVGFFVSVIFKNDSSYDSFMIVLMIVPKKKAIGESESPHFALLEKV
jgi:hypothetical protein